MRSQKYMLEAVWVRINLGTSHLYLGAIYIPPYSSSSSSVINELMDGIGVVLGRMRSEDKIIIFGDFNMPSITGAADPHDQLWFYTSDFRQRDTTFIDGLNFNHLKQLSGVTNGNGRQLDLIFGNSAAAAICGTVHRAPLTLTPEDIYHPALETCITVSATPIDLNPESDPVPDPESDPEMIRS
uniref:Endonuclease/exonuclease/phosphatase domain-containing protein n=1 Tax=Anopheles maculatus TaxID=74869 RepID=A0A182SZL0_9DIPT